MSTVERYIQIDGYDVIDPAELYDHNQATGAQTEFWGRANSYTSQIGMEPGVAWILVTRETLDAIYETKNEYHSITWIDGGSTTTFGKLVLHNATCASLDGDELGPYLLELRDVREICRQSGGITKRYNYSDAMPVGTYTALRRYWPTSLNGGSTWTWQEMLDDIWGGLPSAAGASPGLPYVPIHDPESWRFNGESAWEAVELILKACQSALVCNPETGVLTAVALGDSQGVDATISSLENKRLIDWKAKEDLNKAKVPETVRVLFRVRYRNPQTLEQLDVAHLQWTAIDNATGLDGADSGRIVTIHSDLFDEQDDTSTSLNLAALNATASDLSARVAMRYDISGEAFRCEYSGIFTSVTPGTEIHKVVWRDYGDDDGARTELWGIPEWGNATYATTHRAKQSPRFAMCRLTASTWSQNNGWAYMEGCKIVRYFTTSNKYDENSANETNITVWHPVGYAGNLTPYGTEIRALHTSTGRWPMKFGQHDDVIVMWDDVAQRWEIVGAYEDHWRFELIEDIEVGGEGDAYLRLSNGGASWFTTDLVFRVYDSLELGPFRAGDYGCAKRFGDSSVFEILTCKTLLMFAEARASNNSCPEDTDEEIIVQVHDAIYLPGCQSFNPRKVVNPRRHRWRASMKLLLIRKRCEDGTDEWQVFDVQLRRVCLVHGIEDRDSCLVAAGLRVGGEWCPDDEPTQACKIVEYNPCDDETLAACDLDWSFAADYSCCGQAGDERAADSAGRLNVIDEPFEDPGISPWKFNKDY